MRITQETDYAFRICGYLAQNEGQVIGAPKIASEKKISERFTLRILRKLNLAGITTAKRGAAGGYLLNKPKEEITLYDIIVAVDGPIIVNKCIDSECGRVSDSPCGFVGCKFHNKLAEVQQTIVDMFKDATLDKFMER
ncbi:MULTISPECIES: Rrf2 family transcriptional regulator [Peptoniphilus]|uniref:RrF2 family transcriptional regulator n=1 Tax=Peptoniphilus TaxID=162289 RepID=UPI0001DA9B91|nr:MULTISPECIES: Rrf2 family transcriptional regulator [Peptoniphilus]EFI42148.1 transcriptional regulator, Rrf2 family [Peptoniphilus sp. oral taxon 386 str. F0131]